MNKESNSYTFIFAIVMVVVVAVLLSFAAISLKPIQLKNIKLEKMKNILSSVHVPNTVSDAEKKYEKYIIKELIVSSDGKAVEGDAFDIDMKEELSKPLDQRKLPLLQAQMENGKIYYIIPLRGTGLWGPIWGYVSLSDDLNTIYGVNFDHEGETPGLGAEITKEFFQSQFKNKTIFDKNHQFVSISTVKGAKNLTEHQVDAISGATITTRGVTDMIHDCVSGYLNYFETINNKE